jgi:CHAT domain-containing protein
LEVQEIFGLNLAGANLVVLSACETALQLSVSEGDKIEPRVSEGDEIVGLTRAFLYAGTPAVVTTLWKIDDVATAALMEAFYRYLREGKTTTEALREAQWEIMRQEKWSNPYYWASFSLTGDHLGTGEMGEIRVLGARAAGINPLLIGIVAVVGLLMLGLGGALLWRRRYGKS